MIRWYFCTKNIYENLLKDNKVNPEGMYFLSDTNEYYYKNVNYMRNVVFVTDGNLPETGMTDKHVYFDTTSLKAYTYNALNQEWSVLVEPAKVSVLENNEGVTQMVRGAAVKAYVDDLIDRTINNSVIDISWDATNNVIKFNRHVNENGTVELTINQFAKTIQRDGTNGDIKIIAGDGTTVLSTINIPLDNYTVSGRYDNTEKAIVFTMSNGSDVKIFASSIVDLYNEVVTDSVQTVIENTTGDSTLAFNVKISNVSGNEIELIPTGSAKGSPGLYNNRSHIMDFVTPGRAGAVATLDQEGNSKDSGKSIGGNTISSNAGNRGNLIVTEAALKDMDTNHRQHLADTYVPLASVATQYSNFASAMKVTAAQ